MLNRVSHPKIAFITGGSGSRFLAMELRKHTHNASYIINTSDSGGSTRQTRLVFDMPAIGDFRSRLIDLADRELPGYSEATRLLGYRLPKSNTPAELESELRSLINGSHELLAGMLASNGEVHAYALIIMKALERFQSERGTYEHSVGRKFDLRNASIGNLFLTGLYLEYDRDLEVPIFLYKQLAGVKGNVIPATLDNIHIAARMADGPSILGQHRITASTNGPVEEVLFVSGENQGAEKVSPTVNPVAIEALGEANLIVFSMGSFYTSIISTLLIPGMAKAIRKSSAPKVFIANSVQDEETVGMSVGDMANELVRVLAQNDSLPAKTTSYLTHVIANCHKEDHPLVTTKYGNQYGIVSSDSSGLDRDVKVIRRNLLSQGSQRKYDPELLTKILLGIF